MTHKEDSSHRDPKRDSDTPSDRRDDSPQGDGNDRPSASLPSRPLEEIVANADRALDSLTENLPDPPEPDRSPSLSSPNVSSPYPPTGKTLTLDVEFGRCRLPLDELTQLVPGTILPLNKPTPSAVTLFCGDNPTAEGIILTQDGRIAIKITRKISLFPSD